MFVFHIFKPLVIICKDTTFFGHFLSWLHFVSSVGRISFPQLAVNCQLLIYKLQFSGEDVRLEAVSLSLNVRQGFNKNLTPQSACDFRAFGNCFMVYMVL